MRKIYKRYKIKRKIKKIKIYLKLINYLYIYYVWKVLKKKINEISQWQIQKVKNKNN